MGLQRGLVLVGLVEVVDILVLRVPEDVEAQAARLVPLGGEGVRLDRREEALPQLPLHAHLHPHREHGHLLGVSDVSARPTLSARRAGWKPWYPEGRREPLAPPGSLPDRQRPAASPP